jgi:hypothetical protein
MMQREEEKMCVQKNRWERRGGSVCGKKEEIKSNHMKEAHHTTLSSLPVMASSTPYHIHCSLLPPS